LRFRTISRGGSINWEGGGEIEELTFLTLHNRLVITRFSHSRKRCGKRFGKFITIIVKGKKFVRKSEKEKGVAEKKCQS